MPSSLQGFTPTFAQAWWLLALAITFVIKVLGLSVVYAVWSGVGTVITAAIGIWYFEEPTTALKLASIGLVVIGVMGIHASSRA